MEQIGADKFRSIGTNCAKIGDWVLGKDKKIQRGEARGARVYRMMKRNGAESARDRKESISLQQLSIASGTIQVTDE